MSHYFVVLQLLGPFNYFRLFFIQSCKFGLDNKQWSSFFQFVAARCELWGLYGVKQKKYISSYVIWRPWKISNSYSHFQEIVLKCWFLLTGWSNLKKSPLLCLNKPLICRSHLDCIPSPLLVSLTQFSPMDEQSRNFTRWVNKIISYVTLLISTFIRKRKEFILNSLKAYHSLFIVNLQPLRLRQSGYTGSLNPDWSDFKNSR